MHQFHSKFTVYRRNTNQIKSILLVLSPVNHIHEALPGVLGNRGKRVFISGEQGNKGQILRGTGEQRQYWGTGNIRKQIFDFWGTGEQANLFQGNKGTGTPPPPPLGGPHTLYIELQKINHILEYTYYHQLG